MMSKRDKRPEPFCGCIDPPGPFAPLSVQREFLQSLETLPDCHLVRSLRELALMYIRGMEEHPEWREPGDLN